MPVVTVTLIEGYDEATRRRLAENLTDAVRATIAAPLDGVTVVLDEVAPSRGAATVARTASVRFSARRRRVASS